MNVLIMFKVYSILLYIYIFFLKQMLSYQIIKSGLFVFWDEFFYINVYYYTLNICISLFVIYLMYTSGHTRAICLSAFFIFIIYIYIYIYIYIFIYCVKNRINRRKEVGAKLKRKRIWFLWAV